MENEKLISLKKFCIHYEVKESIILALDDFGLIGLKEINQEYFLCIDDLIELEKILRLHRDLGINLEGIDAIVILLKQIEALKHQLLIVENKLTYFISMKDEDDI